MAAAGYGTKATVESIWSSIWDTTQFNHINKLIGTKFNFYITGDGGTDITDSEITTMLESETHELFAFWNAKIKTSAVDRPWDWIRVWFEQSLSGNKFYNKYSILIIQAQSIGNYTESIEFTNLSGFGSSSDK